MNRFFVAMAVGVGVVSACAVPAWAQDAQAGQDVFKHNCSICHDVAAGRNRVGPSLFGVVGRPAGSAPNFHYTNANKTSALTWDAATLDRYLTDPRAAVPGTSMMFAGVKDDQKRKDLIAYLGTLR